MKFKLKESSASTYSKSSITRKLSVGESLSVDASVDIEGILEAGISAKESVDASFTKKTKHDEEHTSFTTIGGEGSGGSFHLGDKVVPILLDLRPLTDLLNPVLFTGFAASDAEARFTPDLLKLLFAKVKPGLERAGLGG